MSLDSGNHFAEDSLGVEHLDLRTAALVELDRVGDDELFEHAVLDALDSGTGEHTMRNNGSYALGSILLDDSCCFAERACRIADIIAEHYVFALDITQYTDFGCYLFF